MSFFRVLLSTRSLTWTSGGAVLALGGSYWYLNSGPAYPLSTKETRKPPPPWIPPRREEMLQALKASGEFDLLVIGGGATGAGVALDAASRGLKVALVEREDFAAGTSSKATKLVHGGVRYLQKAVAELDYEQYKLVREALHERRNFLHNAPYLSHMLPIMLPIYKYWQVPYYWAGCKLYDMLAGRENMETSYLMSKGKALETFPMLKSEGLVGALVYYDGLHNDSRMNIALVMTAVKYGAVVANYCELTTLHKDSISGKLVGGSVKDKLTGEEWGVRAKGIINATGPFTDTLLKLDNPSHKLIVQPSSGTHITLPNYYSPRTMGLIDPATPDGRVIFFLPWQGSTIAGTTDAPAELTTAPRASEDDIRWLLEEIRRYLSPDIKVRRGDVLSAWSGLRPLIRDPNAVGTRGLVRNHIIHVSPSGLLTIAGGKWTTYRAMAQETVDKAVEVFGLKDRVKSACVTEKLRLIGGDSWTRTMFIGLIQRYGLETDVAKHLSESYGDRAWTVCSFAESTGLSWPLRGVRLSAQYPYIEAEVLYAVRYEYAQTAVDIISRRTRLSFLNAQAALEALPRVVDIMAEELKWSSAQKRTEIEQAKEFLGTMGLAPGTADALQAPSSRNSLTYLDKLKPVIWPFGHAPTTKTPTVYTRSQFEAGEVEALQDAFLNHAHMATTDAGEQMKIRKDDLPLLLHDIPGYEDIPVGDYDYVLDQAGFRHRQELDFDEFIEICANLKEVSLPPVKKVIRTARHRIPVEKSGGGV